MPAPTQKPPDLIFDADRHAYYLDGRRVIGVTEALTLSGIAPRYNGRAAEYAASRGTAVHVAVLLDVRGDLDRSTIAPEINGYVAAWWRWLEYARPLGWEVEAVECNILSRRHLFAGRADLVVMFNGARWLIDIKTAKTLTPANALQTGAYKLGWDEMNPKSKIAKRAVLQLMPDGNWKLDEHKDPTDPQTFLDFLRVAQWKQKHGIKEDFMPIEDY
jgi:hypothetical protein